MSSKIPSNVNVNVKRTCAEIVARFPKIPNVWGYASFPDHNNHRCVDYMIVNPTLDRAAQVALGDAIARYHIDNAERLGVNWIIWNRRIYRYQNTNRGHGWGVYTGPKPHTDHVHVEYDGSAYTEPAGPVVPHSGLNGPSYTFRVAKPTPGYYGPSRPGKVKFPAGAKGHGAVGAKLTGQIGTLKDGRYLVTRWGTWYPLDDNNFVNLNGSKIAPPKKKPAPKVVAYHVDPAKVSTYLYGLDRPGGVRAKRVTKRKPGESLWIAKFVTGPDGRRWGVTTYRTYYAASYLRAGRK